MLLVLSNPPSSSHPQTHRRLSLVSEVDRHLEAGVVDAQAHVHAEDLGVERAVPRRQRGVLVRSPRPGLSALWAPLVGRSVGRSVVRFVLAVGSFGRPVCLSVDRFGERSVRFVGRFVWTAVRLVDRSVLSARSFGLFVRWSVRFCWPVGPVRFCLLYTSPSPRDKRQSRMPSSA